MKKSIKNNSKERNTKIIRWILSIVIIFFLYLSVFDIWNYSFNLYEPFLGLLFINESIIYKKYHIKISKIFLVMGIIILISNIISVIINLFY